MKKSVLSTLLLTVSCSVFAGLIDSGGQDFSVYYDWQAMRAATARQVFPEISKVIPRGLPRRKAWQQDLMLAASGLKVDPQKVQNLLKFVLDPQDAEPVKAPCRELLEFELYAAGRRELIYRTDNSKMPDSWKKLLAMPAAERRYTTIPVIYQNWRSHPDCDTEAVLQMIIKSLEEGCLDTQGCLFALLKDAPRNPSTTTASAYNYKLMFRSAYVNSYYLRYQPGISPKNPELNTYFHYEEIKDDMIWALYLENDETIRKLCQQDPAVRDMIVAIGLTNRDLTDARRVAWEFASQSKVNQLLLTFCLPDKESIELLKNMPEHQALCDQKILLTLTGKARLKAIDQHLKKFPQQTELEQNRQGYTLLSHGQLHALAGYCHFTAGKPHAAAERWLNGCLAEDMAVVAEQVMSIEELIAFCDKHLPQPVSEEEKLFGILNRDQINYLLRNLLARRLMRAQRYDEAEKYFTGDVTRSHAKRFFDARRVVQSPTATAQEKLLAALNMAALMRFHGNILYGTFLEPDNLIAQNNFRWQWGVNQPFVKLNKPDLPRFSYRYKAAELYEAAAGLTEDKSIKAYAMYTAGTLLKYRTPVLANTYFKKLYALDPSLCENNWFKPLSKLPAAGQDFYRRNFFITIPIDQYIPPAPVIREVSIPSENANAQMLYTLGANEILYAPHPNSPINLLRYQKPSKLDNRWNLINCNFKNFQLARYALKLAGDQGIVEADILNAAIHACNQSYLDALWFIKRADRNKPNTPAIRYILAQLYLQLGYSEGIKILEDIVNSDQADKDIRGTAAFALSCFYYNGSFGAPKNHAVSLSMMKKALECVHREAEYYIKRSFDFYKNTAE